MRHEIPSPNFEQALSSFFALRGEDGYLAIQNYALNLLEVRTRLTTVVERVGGNSRKYNWIVQLPFFRAVTVAVAIRAVGSADGGASQILTGGAPERADTFHTDSRLAWATK